MTQVDTVSPQLSIAATCVALGLPRATYYRCRGGRRDPVPRRRSESARKLSAVERQAVLTVLHEDRFVDWAPAQVHAQLLDEGVYLCSPRTMHRILAENAEARERRNQLRHPRYEKPQLLATKPNELWSWDITKLLGPQKWTYYYLYVIVDVFSRYVPSWLLADRESGDLARQLMRETCERQGIKEGQLTVHSDRGSPMKSKTLGQFYADLGVTKTHSRPHVSNDNPFSESLFKTLKYRPEFPPRFGSHEHARGCSSDLFTWYNHEHHHSALAHVTPHDLHYGLAEQRLAERAVVLEAAYHAYPERFVHGRPRTAKLARAVWINPPKNDVGDKNETEPEGSAPSVLPPAQRSGCSSAEPCPPSRYADATRTTHACKRTHDRIDCEALPHPVCPQSDKPRGVGQSPAPEQGAPLAVLQ